MLNLAMILLACIFQAVLFSTPAASAAEGNIQHQMNSPNLIKSDSQDSSEESSIPLNISSPSIMNQNESNTTKIIISFLIISIIFIGGIFFAKKISRSNTRNSENQIRILTQHWLGPKKSLAVVRVAGESILIGITESNIGLIKSLSLLDEDIPEVSPQSQFNQTLSQQLTKVESTPFISTDSQIKDRVEFSKKKDLEDEEYSFIDIRKAVGKKLKNMRTLN